jgi:hypothetical protein
MLALNRELSNIGSYRESVEETAALEAGNGAAAAPDIFRPDNESDEESKPADIEEDSGLDGVPNPEPEPIELALSDLW